MRDPEVVARLRSIWSDPYSLDPGRHAARVTRQIAERLAQVSKALERKHPAEEVAQFLMRCIFTMFAEDADLLPRGQFTALLEECLDGPASFAPLLQDLWRKMDAPDYADRFFSGFKTHLRYFNGGLFHDARAFSMGREEIGELLAASRHDWRYVEPAIFGTLVEQALDTTERRKLGAHYTPRAYVERLVEVTVMEPLRGDWADAQLKAGDARERGDLKEAVAIIRAFHHQLCNTRVLDPACGTGNFLYVSLELMKKLEGDVLEALAELGQSETIGFETVDPHQFLGIELNVRAAAIAELVLWIGYLQQHYRNRAEHPAEPILKAFGNIQQKDAVLTWDGYPELQFEMRDGVAVEVYPNARRPDWPEAEFIVGNPPFIGNKRMRDRLGGAYADALRRAYPKLNEGIDLVMYWWDRAAEILEGKALPLRRFGFVTTNSITQTFNRRVLENHLRGSGNISLIFAIADHPWTKVERSSASVRIAMTVCEAGKLDGILASVIRETGLTSDEPFIEFSLEIGSIAPDLQVGPDAASAAQMLGNIDLAHQGVIPVGEGFRVTRSELEHLGYEIANLPSVVKRYAIGRDLVGRAEERFIIDFYGLEERAARTQYPSLFQIVLDRVKPQRDLVNREKTRDNFWIYAEPRSRMRSALEGLSRFVATCRTSKHRIFSFLDGDILADAKIIAIALEDASSLAIVSSSIHALWAMRTGAMLEDRPNYNHSECFGKFPFPDPCDLARSALRDLGEELDATRKTVQAEHPDLTLTSLYNVLEKIRAGTPLDAKDQNVKERGRVLILKDLHDQIDRATADAYGWPHDLSDEQILERLVALNAERAAEEAAGHVRWLRPNYQIPRFAKTASKTSGALDLGDNVVAFDRSLPVFPKDKSEQPLAIRAVLERSGRAMDAIEIARAFKAGGKRIEPRVIQALYTLVRYGWITPLSDGRFAARRAA
nr:DNA methyltransferase [Brevundimonas vesicularis]